VRLTVAQAVVRFLSVQHSERDGNEQKLFAGCFGIFGHGNVAGVGQALLEAELSEPGALPYHQARNEQGMVHASVAFARMRNRLSTFACTSSIGPGATNMLTGAALATINRLPVLLLPSDIFATRVSSPVLQELELPHTYDVSVNDAFRPLSRFFDRVWRPEQLPAALLAAMRVLTDPAETGAATLALPQDVQAEAHDWPADLFDKRVWHVARPVPEPAALRRAVEVIRSARRPLVVAGGGVIYSEATAELRAFGVATGLASLRPSARAGGAGKHRHHGGQPDRCPGRRRDRHRDTLQRLHDRLQDRLCEPRSALRQHQRRRLRRGQTVRGGGRGGRQGGASRPGRGAGGVGDGARLSR
jgi:3D-(3,5/4)-trihydroxycyclohexane-1,2-dione acylhydrolase (decyclizing)